MRRQQSWSPSRCVLLSLCALGRAGRAQSIKIGYINSETILEQTKEARAATEQFNRDVEGWNQEAQRRKELDDLAGARAAVTDAQR